MRCFRAHRVVTFRGWWSTERANGWEKLSSGLRAISVSAAWNARLASRHRNSRAGRNTLHHFYGRGGGNRSAVRDRHRRLPKVRYAQTWRNCCHHGRQRQGLARRRCNWRRGRAQKSSVWSARTSLTKVTPTRQSRSSIPPRRTSQKECAN
jgi:hypothetical protein